MSVYNESENELSAAIKSILNQTYKNIEFLIAIDNPNNETVKRIIREYAQKDNRIKVIENEKNIGLALSLNRCIDASTGEYIARMDADDIAFENRLMMQYEYMLKNSQCGVLATDIVYVDENGNRLKKPHALINDRKIFKKAMRYGNVIAHSTVMVRKSVYDTVGGYRNFRTSQDYDLWLRLLDRGVVFSTLEEPLMYYKIRLEGISQSNPAKQRAHHDYALYLSKKERGVADFYSEEEKTAYFKKIKLYSDEEQQKYNRAFRYYQKSIGEIKKRKSVFLNFLRVIKSLFVHRQIKRMIYDTFKYKKITKKWTVVT